jgi:hypothetical protein
VSLKSDLPFLEKRRATGINKVCSIGQWFINADGTRANKDMPK